MTTLLRKLCCLLLVFLLFLSFPQLSEAAFLEDEGTEGNASEYATWQGASAANELSIVKEGSYSLKYQCPSIDDWHGQVYRRLSSSFKWRDFISCSVWTYRPAGNFDNPPSEIMIIFRVSSDLHGAGMAYDLQINNDPANTWVRHTIHKSDFREYYDGLSAGDTVTYMGWASLQGKTDANDVTYLDGLDINIDGTSDSTPNVLTSDASWYLFGWIAFAGTAISLFIVVLKTDLLLKFRTRRRSVRPVRRDVKKEVKKEAVAIEEAMEEIRCAFCAGQITVHMKHCPRCGTEIPQCIVCLLPIVQGDDFVKCPYCGSFAHRNHLIEWIKVKGHCPYCRRRLTEFDIPL